MNSLTIYIVLTTSLFYLWLFVIVFKRTNLFLILSCIELVLFSIEINSFIFPAYSDDFTGEIFVLFVLIIALSNYPVGLVIVVIYYCL